MKSVVLIIASQSAALTAMLPEDVVVVDPGNIKDLNAAFDEIAETRLESCRMDLQRIKDYDVYYDLADVEAEDVPASPRNLGHTSPKLQVIEDPDPG